MRKALFILIISYLGILKSYAQVTQFDIDSTKFTKDIALQLDSVFLKDQEFRKQYIQLAQNGADEKQLSVTRSNMRKVDSLNLITVTTLLDNEGWLGPQDVGMFASQGLFLVIQHANLATQEKYFPMIEKAEKAGKTLSSNLAILKDRIAVRNGEDQLYGSQGFTDKTTKKKFLYPIVDVDNLESRRVSMGLPPMDKYLPGWDLKKYKMDLPEIREAVKRLK
ncbi:DUF6624 domain-containing protein [Sphingobacterium sp. ML3W]|uniref:DUF6624 domain-containing protein n=1 Tax=Sphingobacterium sp. ML3W TaxID=1538644 RepID=UPI00068EA71B|nr:DUF6624 domain-containing protein [Sphingobacterium sp. ML3W]